jgi:hypothetical protein
MGAYCLDLVTPFITPLTKLILFALNQYVGKLNIVLKTFKKTNNID